MISATMDFLSEPWLSTAIGLAGIAIGALFYWKSKVVSRLSYVVSDTVVLGDEDSTFSTSLEIRFKGVVVPRVTATQIAFWNAGNVTIDESQIVRVDQLRAIATEAQVLDIAVRGTSNDVICPSLCNVGGTENVDIAFNFLEPMDAFLFQIVHTGDADSIGIAGTLKGLPGGVRPFRPAIRRNAVGPILALPAVGAGIFIGKAAVGLAILSSRVGPHAPVESIGDVALSFAIAFLFFGLAVAVARWLVAPPRKRPIVFVNDQPVDILSALGATR